MNDSLNLFQHPPPADGVSAGSSSSGRVGDQSLMSAEQLLARGAALQKSSRGSRQPNQSQLVNLSEKKRSSFISCALENVMLDYGIILWII